MPDDQSAEEVVNAAPEIAFCGQIPFGKYFRMGTSKGSTWQFYNVKQRGWRYLPVHDVECDPYDHSVLLRDGWIVRKLEPDERHYYYKCEGSEISNLTKTEALQIAYACCPGVAAIQALVKEEYLIHEIGVNLSAPSSL